jgi:hypothetical protein
MSDAPTAPAPKAPFKDMPTSKPEKKASASPDEPTPNAQAAPMRPDLIAAEAAAATQRAADSAVEAVRETVTKALPTTGDVQLLHNALLLASRNVETVINSTNVAIRGAEEATQTAVEYGQRNLEQLSTVVRNLWEVRSVGDLVALHREHTRSVVEDMLEETTRLSLHFTKTLGEIVDTVTKPQPEFISRPRQKAA